MIKVKQMYRTNVACPVTWEGLCSDNKSISVNYRYGLLTVKHKGRKIFEKQIGPPMDGYMSPWELFNQLTHLFKWAKGVPYTCEDFIKSCTTDHLPAWHRQQGMAVMNGKIMAQTKEDDFFSECEELDFFAEAEALEEVPDFDFEEEEYEFDF
jgi:hypothetical protein